MTAPISGSLSPPSSISGSAGDSPAGASPQDAAAFEKALSGAGGRAAAAAKVPSARNAAISSTRRIPVIDKSKIDPEILKAAQGMEAMFLDYMMKQMRQTVPKNEMDLEGPATEIYRGMLDSEYAQKAVQAGGVGLADQIITYLQEQSAPPAPRGNVANSQAPSYTLSSPEAGQGKAQPMPSSRRIQ